ncbi:MAG: ferredoxin--NADP reductase [Phycisphaeraceae bacterium]|nr:ferredoxin--NADP reductase [Phycisphaeraceae bacterium]
MTLESLFNATLIYRQDLTEALSIVRLRLDDAGISSFQAGQFCTVGLPKETQVDGLLAADDRRRLVRRAYSIASPPRWREAIELLVVRVEEGKLTPRLWELKPGARLYVDPHFRGDFTLERVPAGRDLVLVATGTGIAPYVSMLRTYWPWPGEGAGVGSEMNLSPWLWNRVTLVHGVRYEAELAYRVELEALAGGHAEFRYLPVISGPSAGSPWGGLRGRVQVALEPGGYRRYVGAELDPKNTHVFLCGNPAMINDVAALLQERGFITHTRSTPGNLHFERYW